MAGGITAPHGYQAAGAHVGLKRKRKDMCLVLSDVPANVAATFTTNLVKAAPIQWNQAILAKQKPVRGIVVNSGNANSCTGEAGIRDAQSMAQTAAECMGVLPEEVLVASTGIIGELLPMETVRNGVKTVASLLEASGEAGTNAAEAIMTTDSFTKQIAARSLMGGKLVTIGAMAKGSGMIHPNMATMLAFLTTDLNITVALLEKALQESVEKSYNMISVDGDTSTNDMVVLLANGLAENRLITEEDDHYFSFLNALNVINLHLAKAIASDGEGATKFLEVTVRRAGTYEEARKLSKSIVSSNLVKAAFFGEKANWGQILAAMGTSGVQFNPAMVSVDFVSSAGDLSLISEGRPLQFDKNQAAAVLKERDIKIVVDMGEGDAAATAFGCDLGYDYITINSGYKAKLQHAS